MNERAWVDNGKKIYEQLIQGCNHTQYLRELIMNGLQAGASVVCARESPRHPGKIEVVDNGPGIPDLFKMTKIGYDKGEEQNLGMGGKIAALARSRYGVEIQTLVKGYTPTGYYLTTYPSLDASHVLPGTINTGHGTSVVLHGMRPDDETIRPSDKQTDDTWTRTWAWHVVEQRFWDLSEVNVKVQDFAPKGHFRRVVGLKNVLENTGAEHGRVELPGNKCAVLWFILPNNSTRDEDRGRKGLYRYAGIGEGATGILFSPSNKKYEQEIYDMRLGNNSYLSVFGITHEWRRVVLIVAPYKSMGVVSDQTRTFLQTCDEFNNPQPIDMLTIGAAFKKALPAAIRSLLDDGIIRSNNQKHTQWNQKLFALFEPCFSAFTDGARKVSASAGQVTGVGGLGIGVRAAETTGGSEAPGIGSTRPGFVPDSTSTEKHKIRAGRGVPNIDHTKDHFDSRYAFMFSCDDYKTLAGALLVINEDWPVWQEHINAVTLYGRAIPTTERDGGREYIYGRALAYAKSAIYVAFLAEKSDQIGSLRMLTTPDVLTGVAASLRLTVADGLEKRAEEESAA